MRIYVDGLDECFLGGIFQWRKIKKSYHSDEYIVVIK